VVLAGLGDQLGKVLVYLFGQPLTVDDSEIAVILGLGAGIVLVVLLLRRVLFAVVTDEEWSRVAGLPVGFVNALLAVLIAVSVVAAMRIVGILLVAAMMVLPVASGQLLARSFRGTLWSSVVIGVTAVVLGLAASRIWGLAPSGTIVLVASTSFAAVALVKRGRVPRFRAEGSVR
jgi:zinc transport system permease protein